MASYLDDKNFVDFVLEKGSIPFIVHGSISCLHNFNFAPFVNVRISKPTYHLRVIGENSKDPDDIIKVHVRELVDEVVFPGEIELQEHNVTGISKALYSLELWADFLCLAVGHAKVTIEIQLPINVVIAGQSEFNYKSLQRWGHLTEKHFQLPSEERRKLAKVLWWYRKASSAAYYSSFDGYTAYWNCLEILCGVSGSKLNQGEEVNNKIQNYLKNKKEIKAGHILECYNNFIRYSIKEQMKDALKEMVGDEQASQIIYQCFEIKPDEDRLYQIRNDINHGSIRENMGNDYQRVYYRGMLLQHIVMMLIYQKLGHSFSIGMGINEYSEYLQNDRENP